MIFLFNEEMNQKVINNNSSNSLVFGRWLLLTTPDTASGSFSFQFKSRTVCRGKSLHLNCNQPDERLAIYSAAFASAVGSHIYCPAVAVSRNPETQSDAARAGSGKDSDDDDYGGVSNPEQDAVQKCEASFATEAVMKICHGKSKNIFLIILSWQIVTF